MKEYIAKAVDGKNLTQEEAKKAMEIMLSGEATQAQIAAFLTAMRMKGQYVAESLMNTLEELDKAFEEAIHDPEFMEQYHYYLKQYVGRETPLYFAELLSEKYGTKIYLKREDLNHTGAHKINNVIGQILLAKRMGKKKVIAETGAGQHGVATATVCALMNMECLSLIHI